MSNWGYNEINWLMNLLKNRVCWVEKCVFRLSSWILNNHGISFSFLFKKSNIIWVFFENNHNENMNFSFINPQKYIEVLITLGGKMVAFPYHFQLFSANLDFFTNFLPFLFLKKSENYRTEKSIFKKKNGINIIKINNKINNLNW